MRIHDVLVWLALIAPAIARADHVVLGYPGVPDVSGSFPDSRLRFELGGDADFGNVSLGRMDTVGVGFHGELRVRYDRFALAGEHGWLWTTGPSSASLRRTMVTGRYSFWSGRTPIYASRHSREIAALGRLDDWIELGMGSEAVFPPRGDHVSRPALAIGAGFTMTSVAPEHHLGISVGIRLIRTAEPTGGDDHEVIASMSVQLGT